MSASLSPGDRLGRYEIIGPIGAGGMGEVYRARDTRLVREVAVKILPQHLANDPTALERFEREARAIAALSHPNILAILDFGELPQGTYAVMELLEGETLREPLRRGPVPLSTALDCARQMTRGLVAAHAKGIVHRDLKPENVFITTSGLIKILDFGLARMTVPSPEDLSTGRMIFETESGVVLGTPSYMSPEQIRGVGVDHRADLFSLGAILYEMLSGRRPFDGASTLDIISAVLRDEPRELGTLGPPPFRALVGIARRCLEKQPRDRFQSARDLLLALEALDPSTDSERAATMTADTILTGHDPSIAILSFIDLSPEKNLEYFCDGIAEEIINTLAKLTGLRVAARTSAFQFKGKAEDIRRVGERLNVETVLEGSVRMAGNRLRVATQLVSAADGYELWSERFDRELHDVFAVQDEIARAVVAALQQRFHARLSSVSLTRHTADVEAYALYLRGRHEWNKRTEKNLQKSVRYFEAAVRRDPVYAMAHAGLADAFAMLGIYGAVAPGEVMPKAREAAEAALKLEPTLSGTFATLGTIHVTYDCSWQLAERKFARAIELAPGNPTSHHWYAVNYLVPLQRFEEARRELTRALELDPLSLPISVSLGMRSYFARSYEQALDEFRNTLELDSGFAIAHVFLGQTLVELSRYDEAMRALETALNLVPGSPEVLAAIGYAAARGGRIDRAREVAAELEELSKRRYVSPSLIAQVHAALGDNVAALAWLERGCQARAADLAWLAVRPVFDGLRADPRFIALEERLGLPAGT